MNMIFQLFKFLIIGQFDARLDNAISVPASPVKMIERK